MRSKKNVETIKLKDGEYLEKEFNNYVDMAQNAVDWTLFCSYQLQPNFSKGIYKILQLPSMQIAYSEMTGGIMFDFVVPKDCITFSVMRNISKKASIDQMKLESKMIAILDDSKVYNFICSSRVEFIEISLNKNSNFLLIDKLSKVIDKFYIDNSNVMSDLLMNTINKYADIELLDEKKSIQIEEEIVASMLTLIESQKINTPHFKKSEQIALSIKRKLFKHMDHTMSVELLANKNNISTRTLQNAFKSLFDLKPNQFIRLLKLNLVHHELLKSNPSQTSVQRVAQKWGFFHMGRLAKYYADLFGEKPSITLSTNIPIVDGIKENCVERKEEI